MAFPGTTQTRGQLRLSCLQRMGVGITQDGREDTDARPIPLATFNKSINDALNEVKSHVEKLRPMVGCERKSIVYPANTRSIPLLSLGVESQRLVSVWWKSDDGVLYPVPYVSEDAISGCLNVWPRLYDNIRWANYVGRSWVWFISDGVNFGIDPQPSEDTPFVIRVYGSGFLELISDAEPLPPDFVFHNNIQQMLELRVCASVDPRMQRRYEWQAQYERIREESSRLFQPQRGDEMPFIGF